MIPILALINSIILSVISGIHFYWMFGGNWGIVQSLPTTAEHKRVLNPKAFDCGVVAVIFLLMSVFFLHFGGVILLKFPSWVLKYGLWILAGVFLLRAVGDFRYIGFTKTIRSTEFAQLDTKFYAPLCLFLGVSSLLIIIFQS